MISVTPPITIAGVVSSRPRAARRTRRLGVWTGSGILCGLPEPVDA
jgi:hypothetical protein